MARKKRRSAPPPPSGSKDWEEYNRRCAKMEDLFRKLAATDHRLPDFLRFPASIISSGPIAPFSSTWIQEQHKKLDAGELCSEDIAMLRAVEPFVDRELYAGCVYGAGSLGWVIANLEQRRVVYWRVTEATGA